MYMQHKDYGFTLVEILIVLAILGILATILVPSYTKHTLKANRSDAYAALNEIMQAQERYAADNGSYTTDLTQIGYQATQLSEQGRFAITANTCSGSAITQCVLLTATAQTAQKSDKNSGDGLTNIPITLDSRGDRAGW